MMFCCSVVMGHSALLSQQVIEQQLRDVANTLHMGPALAVAELHDFAQHAHQHVCIVLAGTDFVGHHLCQTPLLGVQLDGVGHTTMNNLRIKGSSAQSRPQAGSVASSAWM